MTLHDRVQKMFLIYVITWPFQVKVYFANIGITEDCYAILESSL